MKNTIHEKTETLQIYLTYIRQLRRIPSVRAKAVSTVYTVHCKKRFGLTVHDFTLSLIYIHSLYLVGPILLKLNSIQYRDQITYNITICWVTLLQPSRRAALLGQLSSHRSNWSMVTPQPKGDPRI